MKVLGIVMAIVGSIALGACSSSGLLSNSTPPAGLENFTPIQ